MAVINDIIAPNNRQGAGKQGHHWQNRLRRLLQVLLRAAKNNRSRIAIVVLGLIVIIVVTLFIRSQNTSDFPSSLKDRVGFSIFYPNNKSQSTTTGKPAVNYSAENHAISYEVHLDGTRVVISEQSEPDIFNESGVYSFKLNQAHIYDTIQTDLGEVALTHPDNLNGQTLAWNRTRGTLILAHAFRTLSKDQWTQLFNSLDSVN